MKQFIILWSILTINLNIFSQGNIDIRHDSGPQESPIEKYNPLNKVRHLPLHKFLSNTGYWAEVNPRVPRVDYYGVYLRNQDICFAVGELGTLIKSTDGGLSWADKSFPTSKTLLRIHGFENFIIATGVDIILRSTDYGETWDSSNVQFNTTFWGVQVMNDSMCFLIGRSGEFLKTFNTGDTWEIDTLSYPVLYWDLKFMDNDTGFISCSNGIMLKTTNSGENWIIKQTGDQNSLYSIEILENKKIITAGSSGKIYYSSDYGNTFLQSNVPIQFTVEDLAFADDNIGVAVGQATVTNGINKTTDGGLTWNLLWAEMGNLNVDFISDSVGYNVGMDLRVYKSTDKGESWDKVIINDNLTSISSPNDNSVYLLGYANIFKYSNNRISKISSPGAGSSGTVYFTSDSIGYISKSDAHLFRTTNGGYEWIKVDSSTVLTGSTSIQFIGETGFYQSENYLKKSTTNGNNWVQILAGSNFKSFYFIDSLNGWISGNSLFKTTDGGANWESLTSIVFQDINFIDQDTGYAISGVLYKTTDGGHNWNIINGATGRYLQVIDTSMIITMSEQGKTFISLDYGFTWTDYNLPGISRFLKFTSKARGYYVGNMGLFFSYFDSTHVPVELTSFNGRIENNKVILYWSTASELNNKGFEIQKKNSEGQWYNIGFIIGNGTTTMSNEYIFMDSNPTIGENQFRLKQIDYNGIINFSKVLTLNYNSPLLFKLYPNYPNPFNSQTTIVFYLPIDTNINIKIFNTLGEKVDQLYLSNLKAGFQRIIYNANHLNSGVYFYTTSYSTSEQRGKMLLIK